ncbi:sperm-associated antigen 8-like isoform X2 [Erythrolamprus reginae]|uniref:sperm-associated antigen 8-like isoform X2 n=1 Tax=Erythrolamprus reginae TaxID=121349 RepID=UPI00396C7802
MEPDRASLPNCGEAAAPTNTEEPRGSPAKTAPSAAERPPEPEAQLETADTYPVELPPCHGVPGPYLGELPAADLQPPPPRLLEPAREPPARGQCLLHNWLEERATNALDRVPRAEYGTEGFFHRHGHPALLTLDCRAAMPTATTTKDSFPPPVQTALPLRGKREAMMEHLLYQKHSRSLLGGGPYPPPEPMESLSITHRDYKQGGGPCWAPAPYTAPRLPAGAAPDLLAGTRPAGAGHLQHPNVRRPFQEVHEVHHPCLGPPGPAFARRPRRRPHALKAPLPPPPPGPVRGEHRMGGGQEPQWAEGITTRVSTPPPAPGTAVASRGVKEPSWPAGWPPRAPPRSEAEQILRTHVPPSIHLSVCGGSCSPWGALR